MNPYPSIGFLCLAAEDAKSAQSCDCSLRTLRSLRLNKTGSKNAIGVFRTKNGFTLLELLVASLLMGMMISILTMVFNSSSIAWRTGKAGIAALGETRRKLSFSQKIADNVLPGVRKSPSGGNQEIGLVVGAWDWRNGLRERAVVYNGKTPCDGDSDRLNYANQNFNGLRNPSSFGNYLGWDSVDTRIGSSKSKSTYIVGVKSDGPDRTPGTADDISSWPEDK